MKQSKRYTYPTKELERKEAPLRGSSGPSAVPCNPSSSSDGRICQPVVCMDFLVCCEVMELRHLQQYCYKQTSLTMTAAADSVLGILFGCSQSEEPFRLCAWVVAVDLAESIFPVITSPMSTNFPAVGSQSG